MRNKIAHGGYAPCGLWEFTTPVGVINPKTAMTIIINELVISLLLKANLLNDVAADLVQARLAKMRDKLGWTTEAILNPSPSLTKLKATPDPRQWRN